MLRDGAKLVFSPRDFNSFLEGDFAAWMDRLHFEIANGNPQALASAVFGISTDELKPDETDEETDLVFRKGREHESDYLKSIRTAHPDLVMIGESGNPIEKTLTAMHEGRSIIYQGRLQAAGLYGISDFLVRAPGVSKLGDFHYEPRDTKLAKSAKPHFIVQLCAYAAILESVQGRRPANFEFISGKRDSLSFRTEDFIYYFRNFWREFCSFQRAFQLSNPPLPINDSSAGRWGAIAGRILESRDHLSRIAGISFGQVHRLNEAGIDTMKGLAALEKDSIPGMSASTFVKLRRQAQAQVRSLGSELPYFELLPPRIDRPRWGLTALPPPSDLDVFFDMEGFPLVEDGLEYLFGASYLENGKRRFVDWWAHDREQERRAFEGFVDWAHARWTQDPTMHIYHYAHYETTALENLAQKHGSREAKVDDLLRNRVVVDLYRIVQQGMVIGTKGYSLKDIECLYQPKRTGAVSTAGGSIVEYQKWLDSGESEDWKSSKILSAIRDYNREDCDSLIGLRDWLIARRDEHGIEFRPPETEETEEKNKPPSESALLAETMLAELQSGRIADPEPARVYKLLAQLLEHHWREARPTFWRKFDRLNATDEELMDDLSCLAGLERTELPPQQLKKSRTIEYRFDPGQDTKLQKDDPCFLTTEPPIRASIHEILPSSGRVTLKLGPSAPDPPPSANLIPDEFVSAAVIAESIQRCVQSWSHGAVKFRAVSDLLHRRPPRVRNYVDGPLIPDSSDSISSIIDLVNRLDDTTLCIQGPPGTGKTYTCAHVITDLLRQGKTIGVTANGHKAIMNVLRNVVEQCRAAGVIASIIKVGKDEDPLIESEEIRLIEPNKAESLANGPVVIGGTAWVFSRPELEQKFDYLFIDEAGQFSLANAVGVGAAARNLVLVGDQMQLAQPTQARHPDESGMSALEYLLDGRATIPPDLGVLLDRTFRLHPGICSFISAAVYEDRLVSHESARHRRLILPPGVQCLRHSTGIEFVRIEHHGRSQYSPEEVASIVGIVADLLPCRVIDGKIERPMTLDDILIVAPYNMQVMRLQSALGDGARVGSVDKFQGQQAPVVIVSMCASTLDDAPRGAEFLLNKNRLNVAISRAQCLAIVVGSPALAAVRCSSVEQMRLVNLYCRLMEYADGLLDVK
jgi:uncharacterized protein